MYDTILVPIDLSDDSKTTRMIDAAKKVANPGARIILSHVVDEVPGYVLTELPRDFVESRWAEARASMQQIAASAGAAAEVEVRGGHPANTILEIAEEKGADVIVIASHRPGLQDYLIGSTAAWVVRHARCSVLVLR